MVELAVVNTKLDHIQNTLDVRMTSMEKRTDELDRDKASQADLNELRKQVDGKLSKEEFEPFKKGFWGGIGLFDVAILAAIAKLIGLPFPH